MQQMWEEMDTRLTLGDLFSCDMQVSLEEDANGKQKSAEAIVVEKKVGEKEKKEKKKEKKTFLQTIFFFHEGLNGVNESKLQR